ncbi:MAG: hypothetical protein P8L39_07565 [Halioglobus sp.]|nr:hypothetical protein [Halioglobus sp.]
MKILEKNRRFFLKAVAGTGLLASPLGNLAFGAIAQRTMPAAKFEGDFLRHNDIPWALETRRSSFGFGPITPESQFLCATISPCPARAYFSSETVGV